MRNIICVSISEKVCVSADSAVSEIGGFVLSEYGVGGSFFRYEAGGAGGFVLLGGLGLGPGSGGGAFLRSALMEPIPFSSYEDWPTGSKRRSQ